jgi:hypothetical protein
MSKRLSAVTLLGALLLLLPAQAQAQGDEAAGGSPAGAQSSGGYRNYQASGFGFGLSLPQIGDITNPQSPGWAEAAEVAFEWSSENTPVVLITGRVDTMDMELNEERFKVLCDTMLDTWKEDGENIDVVATQPNLQINNNKWNLIEIADKSSGENNMVHFSVFTTYRGTKVYTITLYYLTPVSDSVREFGKPVLQGFSIQ